MPTLVVMAAGMGSRYGGLKQIDSVGPDGERIIDYALFDAARSGFGKVVFIIRRDIEAAFRAAIEPGLPDHLLVEYVFQERTDVPRGFSVPEDRTKPWGTGHAIWCCRDAVREPFGVINADDFYGRDAFDRLAKGLALIAEQPATYLLVGYRLVNTLSPHGSVSRGVCEVTDEGRLRQVVEKTGVLRAPEAIVSVEGDQRVPLAPDTVVSMNMWGFTPGIFAALEEAFAGFLATHRHERASEFFIPSVIDGMIQQNKAEVLVTPTDACWMGMTYPDDRDAVRSGVEALVTKGEYPRPLWSGAVTETVRGIDHHDGKTKKARHLHRQPHQP
jgi:UTP-glucose-1-phosphate uridylyltransferase